MSTDEMTLAEQAEETKKGMINIPFVHVQFMPPAIPPSPKRLSGIAHRLRLKQGKAQLKLRALEFAHQILSYGTRARAAVLSVIQQYGVSTRDARAIVRDGKPKKHRRRSK